ncbi:hypothetical protein ACW7EJ_10155, partial [Acinetobacter soli]
MILPAFGLGTFRLKDHVVVDAVKTALEVGYRAIDQEGSLFLVRARTILADLSDAEEALLKSDSDTSGQLRVDSATPF